MEGCGPKRSTRIPLAPFSRQAGEGGKHGAIHRAEGGQINIAPVDRRGRTRHGSGGGTLQRLFVDEDDKGDEGGASLGVGALGDGEGEGGGLGEGGGVGPLDIGTA